MLELEKNQYLNYIFQLNFAKYTAGQNCGTNGFLIIA